MECLAVNHPMPDTQDSWRRFFFSLGDFIFFMAIGIATTLVTHGTHQLGWSVWIACPVGMVVAMALQMLMAVCVSPLLGSIEAMTPSMVLGMLAPMPVCVLHIMGRESTHSAAVVWGIAAGMLMFAFVLWYSTICNRRLHRAIGSDQHGVTDMGPARSSL